MELIKHTTYPYWGMETMIMEARGKAFVRIYRYIGDGKSIFIECLSVDESERKKGIASFLLKEVDRIASELNAETISLSVKKDSWVYDWYIRIGFHWFVWDCKNQNTVWLRKVINNKQI